MAIMAPQQPKKRTGIRIHWRDGRPARVWEANDIRFELGRIILYDKEFRELAIFNYLDVVAYEYVDLGPDPATLSEVKPGPAA